MGVEKVKQEYFHQIPVLLFVVIFDELDFQFLDLLQPIR